MKSYAHYNYYSPVDIEMDDELLEFFGEVKKSEETTNDNGTRDGKGVEI